MSHSRNCILKALHLIYTEATRSSATGSIGDVNAHIHLNTYSKWISLNDVREIRRRWIKKLFDYRDLLGVNVGNTVHTKCKNGILPNL
jgi:hypothetical protein